MMAGSPRHGGPDLRGRVPIATTVVLKCLAAVVAFLLVGNVAILAASVWARETTSRMAVESVPGIDHLQAVDEQLWRGGAPSSDGYRNLAAAGTATIVDLRAEDGLQADADLVRELGMNLVQIPVRDGQVPSVDNIREFLAATGGAGGRVFVHCGAGVGRTGAMVGAYLVAKGDVGGTSALRRNLAVGPPSLEQVAFVASLSDNGHLDRPGPLLTAVSRILDAPRRLWSRFGV